MLLITCKPCRNHEQILTELITYNKTIYALDIKSIMQVGVSGDGGGNLKLFKF